MPRWILLVSLASTVVIAVVVGVLWYVIGGWPRDHDKYGKVPIPGTQALELPQGEVRLSFEGQVSGGQSRVLEDPPEGLQVRVRQRGQDPLKIESVPSSLYTIASGDTGHEPYGKVEVPQAGRYTLRTTAQGGTPSGQITAGPELWNPLDSRPAGALLIALAAALVLLIFEIPILLMARGRGSGM